VSPGIINAFWRQHDGRDQADDQIVPIKDAGKKSVKLLKKGTLNLIPGGAHGMATVRTDQITKELLDFIQG